MTTRTFLGAAITSFTCNMGWGNTASTVTVNLVNDPNNGHLLSVPTVGEPKLFTLDDWQFGGIVTSYKENNSQGGNPTFEVVLQDPREILSNTIVICDGYTEAVTAVPNIINAYGYWESFSFGNSGRTEAGIPWKRVRDAINILTTNTSQAFGGNIYLKGYSYELDISALPQLPESYRITSSYMSIMDFILEICSAANNDFYFELETTGRIRLYTVDKNYRPQFGAIERFLRSTPNAVQKNFGREFKNEVTSKFLAGANREELLLTYQEGENDGSEYVSVGDIRYAKWLYYTDKPRNDKTYEEYKKAHNSKNPPQIKKKRAESEQWDEFPIWPYWGLKDNGDVIIGEGYGNKHRFTINSQWVPAAGIGNTYDTDVGELLAAQFSMDSWEQYLAAENTFYYIEDSGGSFIDYQRLPDRPVSSTDAESDWEAPKGPTPNFEYARVRRGDKLIPVGRYKHKAQKNPHFGKATKLGLASYTTAVVAAFLIEEGKSVTPTNLSAFSPDNAVFSGRGNIPNETKLVKNSEIVWGYLKQYADEYLGKAFSIKVPDISSYVDFETNTIITSHRPQSEGFLAESVWLSAISNNILPEEINKFTTENGKVYAYVRFAAEDVNRYDFSEINTDSIAVNLKRDSRGKLENRVGRDNERPIRGAFIKIQVQPEVVYGNFARKTDPRVVIRLPGAVRAFDDDDDSFYDSSIVVKLLKRLFVGTNITQQEIDNRIKKHQQSIASDSAKLNAKVMPVIPDLAVVGLYFKNDFYGPWTIAGTSSKTEYEQDSSLAPWNYGGYSLMNAAAEARLSQLAATNLDAENGTVQVPGFPVMQMGQQLIAGGPYITNISVSVESNGGYTTTYNMNTWSYHPYKLAREQTELLKRTTLRDQKTRRLIRDKTNVPEKPQRQSPMDLARISKRNSSHTSSTIISAEIVDDNIVAAIQPFYNAQSQVRGNINSKAIMSLDGLFCPFTTDINATGLPHLEPESTGSWLWLNRFAPPNNISIISNGSGDKTYNTSEIEPTGNINGIALRAPLFLAGWGYSTSGDRVGDSTHPSGYVVGPLDVKWNGNRGLWEAGSSSTKLVKVIPSSGTIGGANSFPSGIGALGKVFYCQEYTVEFPDIEGSGAQLNETENYLYAGNFRRNIIIPETMYLVYQINDKYVLDNQVVFQEYM